VSAHRRHQGRTRRANSRPPHRPRERRLTANTRHYRFPISRGVEARRKIHGASVAATGAGREWGVIGVRRGREEEAAAWQGGGGGGGGAVVRACEVVEGVHGSRASSIESPALPTLVRS
jgi:hypothetical protein